MNSFSLRSTGPFTVLLGAFALVAACSSTPSSESITTVGSAVTGTADCAPDACQDQVACRSGFVATNVRCVRDATDNACHLTADCVVFAPGEVACSDPNGCANEGIACGSRVGGPPTFTTNVRCIENPAGAPGGEACLPAANCIHCDSPCPEYLCDGTGFACSDGQTVRNLLCMPEKLPDGTCSQCAWTGECAPHA
jgi:hypothetical protein